MWIEFDRAPTVHLQAQPPVFVNALDGGQLAVRNFELVGRRSKFGCGRLLKNSASPPERLRLPAACADRKFAAYHPAVRLSAGLSALRCSSPVRARLSRCRSRFTVFMPASWSCAKGRPASTASCCRRSPIEQHTVVRMEPIHKFMHLPGRCQRGFVEYIEPFLPAIRLLSTNQMLLQRRCLHACVPELLRRAGRRRETFVRSRASTYPLRCRGSSEIKVASDGFTMLISSQAWLAEGDVSVPPLLLQLLEPAVAPPVQVCTSQLFAAHAEVANWPVVCMLADHAQGAETASICKACYERLQERMDCAKAAGPPHRRKRCAQIVYDAVWADPSDPSKTYTNAAARYSRNCASAPEWPA